MEQALFLEPTPTGAGAPGHATATSQDDPSLCALKALAGL